MVKTVIGLPTACPLPFLGLPLPFLDLTTVFPRAVPCLSPAFSLTSPLPVPCYFLEFSTACPWLVHCFPLPFLDLSTAFLDLPLPVLDLSTAFSLPSLEPPMVHRLQVERTSARPSSGARRRNRTATATATAEGRWESGRLQQAAVPAGRGDVLDCLSTFSAVQSLSFTASLLFCRYLSPVLPPSRRRTKKELRARREERGRGARS